MKSLLLWLYNSKRIPAVVLSYTIVSRDPGSTSRFQCVSTNVFTCFLDTASADDCSTFAYLEDNHTSVLGMRELAYGATANVLCLTRDEAHAALLLEKDETLSSTVHHPTGSVRNSLFAYPAQSNFSGTKYPLEWIETCQNGALDRYTGNTDAESRSVHANIL